ncbi:MAG: transglycosylase SLT domain-containing protein [Candidatus Melainabacteria bacterium]|nr:transglycosylase SLT domain-containing protein [Candidatus Melainabacteria bacterium]
MRKLPHIFLITLAISLTVGCSSPAQTQLDDDDSIGPVNPPGTSSDAADGGSGTADHDATDLPDSTSSTRRISIVPQLDPGFIKVSKEFREAVGSVGQAPPAQSIELLQAIRKNAFAPGHEKQLAAYVLAGLVAGQSSSTSAQEAFKLYEEAAAHDPLSTPARMKAADIALGANDEKKIQHVLVPLLKKAEHAARKDRENTKTQGEEKGVWQRAAKLDPVLPEALYKLGESYYRSRDYGAATNVFERVREFFPGTETATGASFYLGTIALETAGDWKTAQKEFRHYLHLSPGGKNSIKIVQLMIDACQPKAAGSATAQTPGATPGSTPPGSFTQPLIELTATDRSAIALALYKHGRFHDALDTWNQIGSKHIYRSVCLMKTGKRQEGITALLQAVEADPKNPNIEDVTSAFCKPVPSKEALALWQEVLKRKPEKIDVALWNVAKRFGAPAGAPYYDRLITERPTSEFAPESAWWLVWSSAKQGYSNSGANKKVHLARALEYCNRAMQTYSKTHIGSKFAFWRGKLQEAVGQKQLAIGSYAYCDSNYPGSYYGYRSKHRLRHLRSDAAHPFPDRKWSIVVGRGNADPNWVWPQPPSLFQWQKMPATMGETAATLMWLRQYNDCFKYVTGKIPPEVRGWVLFKQGLILKAGANASLKLEGYPQQTAHWRFAYPLAHAAIVEREARKRNVDPLLIHGLIRQESRYDDKAVSRSNAMGLMQLLKGTAYGVAKHNGITLNAASDIFKPDTNIQLGTAYIAYVLKRAEGNAMYAVASYNGGPNAVAKWIKQHQAAGISDQDAYVENIPYDETRDYVRKVFAHYWNYEHLYLPNQRAENVGN